MFLAVASLFSLISGAPAPVASFDCAKATSVMEKAICTDPKLGAQDVEMARLYAADLGVLSPTGQVALRDSQRAFLKYAAVECAPEYAGTFGDNPVARCLSGDFAERISKLKTAVQTLGDRKFVTMWTYRARAVVILDDPDHPRPFMAEEISSLIQVDAPKTAAEEAWNAQMRQTLGKAIRDAHGEGDAPAGATFETDDYTQVYVTEDLVATAPDLIVTEIDEWGYDFGTAHGHPRANRASNWSLKLGRDLTYDDLFDAAKSWKTALLPVAQANLNCSGACVPAILKTIDEPGRWRITAKGLTRHYGPYEIGGYASNGDTVLSWKDLMPYLRKPLVFDRAVLVDAPVSGN